MAAADTETATFAFNLEGNAAAVAGEQADALAELKDQLSGGLDELREMQKALRNLKGAANVSSDSLTVLKSKIAAQRAVIGTTQESYLKLGGSFKTIKRSGIDASGGLKGLGQAFAGIAKAREASVAGRAIGALRDRVKSSLGPMGQYATEVTGLTTEQLLAAAAGLALVGAIAAVTAAVVSSVAGLTRYALAQADARRSELLRLEGLTKIRYWMYGFAGAQGRAADSASFLQSQIDAVSASVAIGRDKIGEYATQLYKMGLRGGNLQAALKGVATTAAVQGDGQAQIFASWAAGTAAVGGSVKKLADDVESRLGGIARAQLLSLDVQTEKLHESFTMLFSNLKLDRFLTALQSVTSLFSQSTASGRGLKTVLNHLMQPLIDGIAAAGPYAKRFFQGLVIGALAFTIALLTIRKWWKQTFGDTKGIDATTAALYAGVAVATLLAAGLSVAAIAMVALAVPVLLVVGAFALLGYAIYKLFTIWNAIDWSSLGSNIVHGIVDGITAGAKWVWDAMSNLAGGAWKAFRAKLDMHSPSRLFKRDAKDNIGGAISGGLNEARANVDRSARALVDAPANYASVSPGSAPGGIGGTARAGGAPEGPRVSVVIQQLTLGGTNAKEHALEFRRELEDVLEGLAISLGGRRATT